MDEQRIKKIISDEVKKGNYFSNKRVGDTPTDALQLVPKKYVNLNGTSANRPKSSIASLGQQYFDTSYGRPIYWNGTKWIDGGGSVV